MQQMWQKSLARKPLATSALAFAPDGRLWRATVNQGLSSWRYQPISASIPPGQGQSDSRKRFAADGEKPPAAGFRAAGRNRGGLTPKPATAVFRHARFSWSKDGGGVGRRLQTINDDPAPISHRFLALDWSSKG